MATRCELAHAVAVKIVTPISWIRLKMNVELTDRLPVKCREGSGQIYKLPYISKVIY